MSAVCDFAKTAEVLARNSASGVWVYKAKHVVSGLEVAWKEITCPSFHFDRIKRESYLQSSLNHPYIAPILAKEETIGPKCRLILVSPLAETDLNKEIIKRETDSAPWTEAELLTLLAMCIQALAYCQLQGLSHRDLKPANIFLTSQGVIQLGDFGSAKEVGATECEQTFVGTPRYLSPALRAAFPALLRCRTKPIYNAYKSDVYSLAITFLHMAKLDYPEELETLEGLQSSIENCVANLTYGEELKTVLRSMLTVDEGARPDFVQLLSWIQSEIKPIASAFYAKRPKNSCSSCSSPANYICICNFPVPLLCSTCTNSHTSAGHCIRPLPEAIKYNSLVKVQRHRAIAEKKRALDEAIKGVGRDMEQLGEKMRGLVLAREEAEEMLAGDCDAIEYCPFPATPLDAQSTSLPCSLIPVFQKQQVFLYCPSSLWRSFALPSLCIDSCSSLALVSAELVLAVGGEASPRQAVTVSCWSGEIKSLGQCEVERKQAGVVAALGSAFIFGGQKVGKSAEKLPLAGGTSTPLACLPAPKRSFTPCLYSNLIYLPGASIHTYDPATDLYRLLTVCGLAFECCSCIVQTDTLYCFTSLGAVWLDLRKNRPVVRTAAWGTLEHCSLLVWLGDSVYISGNGQLRKLRMDTKEITTVE